jgi:hypothetical protein
MVSSKALRFSGRFSLASTTPLSRLSMRMAW